MRLFRRTPRPPDELAVARRALCLAALGLRGALADGLSEDPSKAHDLNSTAAELDRWMERQDLVRHQSRDERDLFRRSLANWTEQDIANAAWRTESFGVLLWALSVLPALPPYDEQLDNAPKHAPIFAAIDEFLTQAQLRPPADIARERDRAELWHWRSRTTQLAGDSEFAASRPEIDLDEIVRMTSGFAFEADQIPTPIDEDFPALGKAYRDLSDDELSFVTSIAIERHFALNWLCGYSSNWDETPTDT